MKRKTYILGAAAVALTIGAAALVTAPTFAQGFKGQMGQGYGMGPGQGQTMMASAGMGPGGMGKGMMRHKGFRGQGNANCPRYNQQTLEQDMTVDDVKAFMQRRLDWRGNDRLKIGKVEASGENTIVAEIVTVDDSLVRKVQFDTKTGVHRPIN